MRVLIIGNVEFLAADFEKQGTIVRLFKDTASFREISRSTFFLQPDQPLVLGDFSLVRASGTIAKFLEDAKAKHIICLASRDNFDSVVLSRFDKKKKLPRLYWSGEKRARPSSFAQGSLSIDDISSSDPSLLPLFLGADPAHVKRLTALV